MAPHTARWYRGKSFHRSDDTMIAPQRVEVSALLAAFDEYLDSVEKGLSFVIIQDGKVVARLIPDPQASAQGTT